MPRLRNIIILIFFVCTTTVFSQSIEGTVIDQSSFPIPFAKICRKGTTSCSYSNDEGRFKLTASINDSIHIVSLGYHSQDFLIKNTNGFYSLKEKILELDEVFIEGQTIKEAKEEEGYAVDIVETQELKSQSIELNQVLDQTAGIKVRQEGGLGSKTNFTINGLSNRAVRFFLDGVPMDYFGSSYSINTIPISLVDRIEVYKGVVPIELGNDALGGAINLVTKTNFENSAELSYSYGSFNTHRTSFLGNWRDSLTDIVVKASAFFNYSDNNYSIWGNNIYATDPTTFEIQRGIKVKRFHDSFKSTAIKLDVGVTEKKWADQLYFGVLYSKLDKEIQHGVTMEIPFGEATYHQTVVMPNLTYKKYDFLIKDLYINAFSGYSVLNRTRVDTSRNRYNWYGKIEGQRNGQGEQSRSLNSLTDQVILNRINLTYNIKAEHKVGLNFISNHVIRANEDPLITTTDKGFLSDQYLNKQVLGLAYQNNIFQDKFQNSVFVKAYNYKATVKDSETILGETSYFDIHVSDLNLGYGFASSYKLTPRLILKGSAEKSIRMPDNEEVFGDGLNIVSSSTLPQGQELKPEKSMNFNMGIQSKIIDLETHQLSLASNLFYRNTTDLIRQRTPSQNTNINTFVFINIEKVLFKGVDVKLEYKLKKQFNISQNLSYLIPTVKTKQNEVGISNVTYNTKLPNIPFLQTNTSFKYFRENFLQKKSHLMVYWNIAYVAEFYRNTEIIGNENKNIIPAQFINNLGLGYTFPAKKLSLSFDIRNIFNEQVFDNFAVQKPGRAAYVKVKYRLAKQ